MADEWTQERHDELMAIVQDCGTNDHSTVKSREVIRALVEIENLKEEVKDKIDVMNDLMNYGWGFLYPGKTDWDYPGQVINHLKAEIEITRRKLGKMCAMIGELCIIHGELIQKIDEELYDKDILKSVEFLERIKKDVEEMIGEKKNGN